MSFLSFLGSLFGCTGQSSQGQKAELDALVARELQHQEAAKKGNKNPRIEVIGDPQQVARLSQSILSNSEKKRKSEQEAAQKKTLAERYKSGDKTVVPALAGVLRSGTLEQKKETLWDLRKTYDDPENYTITEPELVQLVYRNMEDPACEKEVVQLAGISAMPGYEDRFEERLLSGRSTDAGRLLYWLGQRAESDKALDYAGSLIRSSKLRGEDLDEVINALEGFGRKGTAEMKRKVGDLALYIYDQKLIKKERFEDLKNSAFTSDAAETLLICLFEYGDSRTVPIAKDILSRRIRVDGPVKALLRLEGERHLEKVYQYLGSKDEFFTGLNLVESMERKYVDDRLLREVLTQFGRRKEIEDYQVDRIVSSFTRLNKKEYLENIGMYVSDKRVVDRLQRAYVLSKTSVDVMLSDLQAAGLIKEALAESDVQKIKEEAGNNSVAFIYGVLEAKNVYFSFDAETGFVPADYDKLLEQFAKRSEGVLKDLVVWMEVKEGRGGESFDYTLQVLHQDKVFIARPVDMGDWYDIMTVNALLDAILEQTGTEKRFVSPDTGDQTVQYIFGDPVKIREVLKKYEL